MPPTTTVAVNKLVPTPVDVRDIGGRGEAPPLPVPPSGEAALPLPAPPDGEPPATDALTAVQLVEVQLPRDPFPRVGAEFCGFRLVHELGRGGMGRVYLARQLAMAGRRVALKVGTHLSAECEKLAKLQHPNVVPVYSFHEAGRIQAVCMPYRGPLTLGHVVSRLRVKQPATRDGRALTTAIADCRKAREESAAAGAAAVEVAEAVRRQVNPLSGLSFIDGVLTLGRGVAAGLTFAHGEGIVHADLKPGNVLIADDGHPQLLDFGIAFDRSAPAGKGLLIGGTRPYSSPEQLRSIRRADVGYDERTDVYALGVILYEMLAGRLPYAPHTDDSNEGTDAELAARFVPPPPLRGFDRRIPPAVEAIVARCLAPTADDRYQTAAEVLDDLDRQLARRPLRFAANTSRRELVGKWATRNRWLLVGGAVLLAGGAASAGFARHSARQDERLAVAEAATAAERFEAAVKRARLDLAAAAGDADATDAAVREIERTLETFAVGDGEWWAVGALAAVPGERADRIRDGVANVLLDLGRTAGGRAARSGAAADRESWLARGAEWNRRAEATFAAATRGVLTQRARLLRLAGRSADADEALAAARAVPLRTAADYRTEGCELLESGRWKEAGELLAAAGDLDPTDFWSAYALGVSRYRQGFDAAAVAAFDVCLALDPAGANAAFNRGLAHLRLGTFDRAEADFTRALDLRDARPDPYLNRATARAAQGKFAEAAEDLTEALKRGASPTAVRLSRARVSAQLGDDARAREDWQAGLAERPTDERGWIARAEARLPADAGGGPAAFKDALADLDEALALNPRSTLALQLKARAHSLAGDARRAVAALTALLDVAPQSPDALSGRAVLHARLGDRAAAHADAEAALTYGGGAARTEYQAAGVYALTADKHPGDKREALRLLASALRQGFGFEHLDKDPELDPIRNDPDFAAAVEDARRAVQKRAAD